MPNAEKLDRLRKAIDRELTADKERRQFTNLVDKIAAYEYGLGPSPTVDEFLLWRAAIEKRHAQKHFDLSGKSAASSEPA